MSPHPKWLIELRRELRLAVAFGDTGASEALEAVEEYMAVREERFYA